MKISDRLAILFAASTGWIVFFALRPAFLTDDWREPFKLVAAMMMIGYPIVIMFVAGLMYQQGRVDAIAEQHKKETQ